MSRRATGRSKDLGSSRRLQMVQDPQLHEEGLGHFPMNGDRVWGHRKGTIIHSLDKTTYTVNICIGNDCNVSNAGKKT